MTWLVYKGVGWEAIRLFNYEPVDECMCMWRHPVLLSVFLGQFKLPYPHKVEVHSFSKPTKGSAGLIGPRLDHTDTGTKHLHLHRSSLISTSGRPPLLLNLKHSLSLSCLQQWRQIRWHWWNSKPPLLASYSDPKNLKWIHKHSEQNADSHWW